MRRRLEAGCAFLGKTVVLGQGEVGATTTGPPTTTTTG